MPVGIHLLRDVKEQVYNHVKRLRLPYTIVEVGWWYQLSLRRLPSSRTDYMMPPFPIEHLAGDGNVLSAITHLDDIGRYVAKIIIDDRTLNKHVLVYNELWSQNQICDLLEELSGETLTRTYNSLQELQERIDSGLVDMPTDAKALKKPDALAKLVRVVPAQYLVSWGIRGDNTPEYARYLGYLTSDELYPDFRGIAFRDHVQEVLDGKAKRVHTAIHERLDNAAAVTAKCIRSLW